MFHLDENVLKCQAQTSDHTGQCHSGCDDKIGSVEFCNFCQLLRFKRAFGAAASTAFVSPALCLDIARHGVPNDAARPGTL